MSNSDSSYYGGVPMVSVDDAEEIAELCMLAGRPERIAEFLGGRLTPGEVRNRLATCLCCLSSVAMGQPKPRSRGPPTEFGALDFPYDFLDRPRALQRRQVVARRDGVATVPTKARESPRTWCDNADRRQSMLMGCPYRFLRNHAPNTAAMDLFVVPTIGFNLLYAIVIMRLGRRRLIWSNVTANPTVEWLLSRSPRLFHWIRRPIISSGIAMAVPPRIRASSRRTKRSAMRLSLPGYNNTLVTFGICFKSRALSRLDRTSLSWYMRTAKSIALPSTLLSPI